MASKELTARIKLDSSDAEAKLKRLDGLIKSINKAVTGYSNTGKLESSLAKQVMQAERVKQATLKTEAAQAKLSQEVAKTNIAEQRLAVQTEKTKVDLERIKNLKDQVSNKSKKISNDVSEWAKNQQKVKSFAKSTDGIFGSISGKLKMLASTYLGIMGMKAMIDTSDVLTSTQNKLNNLNGGDSTLTQTQMDKMYVSANKVRMAYTDMAANASKSMTLAGDAFQGNMDNAIRFQEIMAETYALGGADAGEMSSSMYQLIQALGSGTLAGDELRSVREGAPLAYKAIEEFAQGVYNTDKSLKELASQGKITSDMVVAAIMDAGGEIDDKFENTAMTFAQAWDRIKNAAVKAFEPVANSLNEMLNKAAKNGVFEKIEQAFWNISKVIQITFKLIEKAVAWIVDNWDWLSKIIVGGLALMAALWIYQGSVALIASIKTLIGLGAVAWIIIIVIAAVLALAYVFLLWKTGAIDTCQAIIYALCIVGLAIVLIGLITGNIVLIIIAAILAVAALFFTFTGEIVGTIYGIGAVIGAFCSNVKILWQNMCSSLSSWFLNGIADMLEGCDWLLNAINKILEAFGKGPISVDGIRQLADKAKSKGGNSYVDYGDAWANGYSNGYSKGEKIKDSINSWGSQFQSTGGLDGLGKKLGLDFGNGLLGTDSNNLGVGDSYNTPSNDLLKAIKGDTGSISDNLELSKEDLDDLRKIAEMEWKKEFTTASITVDMSNYNTISGDSDLDGIVTKLADKLYEEMNVVANGVYA